MSSVGFAAGRSNSCVKLRALARSVISGTDVGSTMDKRRFLGFWV